MRVVLGNRHAIDAGEKMSRGKRATVVDPDESESLSQVFLNITAPTGIWATHAADGAAPAWVASDSPALAALLAEHYGGIEVRDLEDPDAAHLPAVVAKAASALIGMLGLVVLSTLYLVARTMPFLKTNYGNDFQSRQMAGAASATAVAKFIGLSANTTAPAVTDTTLTGEIVTAGLTRQAGTYAHTTGAASYTITTTFTAQAADVPVTVGKRGVFEAISGGSMIFATLVTPTATLSAAGDTLTLTDTVTL